jgi:peptide/nickel transport system substrate-binding protein
MRVLSHRGDRGRSSHAEQCLPSSRRRRVGLTSLGGVAIVGLLGLLLAACGSSSPSAISKPLTSGKPLKGGVASYAMPIGEDFSWMLPLENESNYEDYDSNVEGGMWRPLYFAGGAGKTGINYALSIGNAPIYSDHDTTVTVTLKHDYTWSDGKPVTTADVRLFFELEAAGAKNGDYAAYLPGEMPDDIKSITYNSPYELTIHLTGSYNPDWFTGNQLTWVYPLPQQSWDKTCASCAVGHDAATPAGAAAVYKFLYDQSEDLSTYATNPLWKVVDGPWVLTGFNPTTYLTVMSANAHYSGPDKPRLAGYKIYSFSSDTAELDAVRAGTIDFGFLPNSDVASASYYESHGFTVAPWSNFYNETVELGYTNKTYGPLVRQLYIRQALQHLVDESLYLKQTLHGYGLADYGVAPDYPGSDLVSPALRHDPYPYSITAAEHLLSSHGWVKDASGTDVCQHPGTASNECGAGIAKGRTLSLSFMYSTGTPSYLAQVEAFQTAAQSAGIDITLNGQTENTMYSIAGVCPPGPCNWGLAGYSGFMWDFGQYEILPVGGNQFGKGNYWAGGYASAKADALIKAAHTEPGLQPLYNVEDYLQSQVASLWWPVSDYEIVLAANNLRGWSPLNPYDNYHPSSWYFVR